MTKSMDSRYCWSRFFDPASGKLKDVFVAALAVQKEDIISFNLASDASEAFRRIEGRLCVQCR